MINPSIEIICVEEKTTQSWFTYFQILNIFKTNPLNIIIGNFSI